jgi:hypothetical protein
MSTAAPPPPPKQQLKLKLRQSPGSDPNTPAARSSATPGVIVDNDALLRQQRHVLASMTNSRSSRPESQAAASTPAASSNPFSGPRGAAAAIAPLPAQLRAAGSPAAMNGFKQDMQSPALSAIRPASTIPDSQNTLNVPMHTPHPIMAPPRLASGSPYPNGPIGQQTTPMNGHYQQPVYVPPSALRQDTFRKVPLKSESPFSLCHDRRLTSAQASTKP